MKKILSVLLICCALFPVHSVLAASADTTLPVLSRGHIQDLGDYPADGSWVASPNRIGTVGQSKRIEGFELKAGDSLPTDLELRYNVHVQNIGWLYDENDPTTWAKNGDYAGTRGDSLRIEAIKIILLDASGNKASGYHVHYQGHVQDVGDLPANSQKWVADGDQLGTVGSSLRLEALKLEIVKDASTDTDLGAYTALIKQLERLTESDYTKSSWTNLQTVLKNHIVTDKNTTAEVADAVKAIEAAIHQLEKLNTTTVYDKPGTYGPTSGSETISSDVVITSTGVTLQNLIIDGDLIIDEAVGDGDVTLNNVTVTGELRVRGGGKNSIHINGGDYQNILVEKTATGAVRIVATGLDGVPFVLSENAAGEEVILEGHFDAVTVNAPDAVIKTDKQTSIKQLNIAPEAKNSTVNLGSQTTVTDLSVQAPTKVTGTGNVSKAEIASDNVSFEKAPEHYTVDPVVVVPPVIPSPTPQPGGGGGYTPPSKISLSMTTAPTVALSKTYDGTTATDVTNKDLDATAVTGIVSGDVVTVTATAAYGNKNAGSGKTITISYALTGTDAAKYTAPANKTITNGVINQKQLSVTIPTITKVYDGSNATSFTVTAINGIVSHDTVAINCAASFDSANAGTGKSTTLTYSLTGADASNYLKPVDSTINSGEITKKMVTIAGTTVETTKTYNGNDEAAIKNAGTSTDFINGETVGIETKAYYDSKNVGTHPIYVTYTLTGTTASNYTVTYTDPKTLADHSGLSFIKLVDNGVIDKIQLTTTGTATVADKIYDGNKTASISSLPQVNGVLDGNTVNLTATATFENADAETNKKVTIDYQLTSGTENYLAPVNATTTATITPRVVGFTIDTTNKSKAYDGKSQSTITATLSQSGESAVLTGDNLSCSITAIYKDGSKNETKNIGTNLTIDYTINLTGADQTNYCFDNNATTITKSINGGEIHAKPIKITGTTVTTSKTYDRSDVASVTKDGTSSDIISDDDVTIKASAYYDNQNAGTNKPIYVTYALTGAAAGNYQIAYENSQTLSSHSGISFIKLVDTGVINKVQLTADNTATVADKTYDGTTTASVTHPPKISGFLNGDTFTLSFSGNFADANAGENKPVSITYQITGGTGSENYLPPINGTATATIAPLEFDTTKNFESCSKEYDGTSKATVKIRVLTQNQLVTDALKNQNITFEIVADYTDGSGNKKSAVGSNYTIAYSFKLIGEDAKNFKLTSSDANNVITGSESGGSITQKTLTITPPDIKTSRPYDGTSKVYDVSGAEISASYNVTASQISGLVAGDNIAVTTNLSSTDKDAGEQTVTIHYSIDGSNRGNYQIANQMITVTITPLQLTVDSTKLPTIAATRKYDATRDVYLANNTTKLSDYPLDADAVSNLINDETVTVKATASYDDKNVSSDGSDKPVTIAFTLDGTAAGNYLAPADDTSKAAAITARTLGYANVVLETMKKVDSSSSVKITHAEVDPTQASGDGVVHHEGTVTREDVQLATYSANYYESDLKNTTSATGSHPIKITGTLTGSDATGAAAGNYVLADDIRHGEILPVDAVISATYANNSGWLPDWSVSTKTLTLPDNVSGIEPFYNDTTKFYGLGSGGKIYQSDNLSNWTQYTGDNVSADDNLSSAIYQLIGIDNDGVPLAVDSNGKIYYWSGSDWQYNGTAFLTGAAPQHNFTYFADTAPNSNKDYLIYQDSLGNVYKSDFNNFSTLITTQTAPKLLSNFSNSLLAYNGTILELYAY